MSGDIKRFWVTCPEFTYGRKLVVLASHHDTEVARLQEKIDRLQKSLDEERKRSADWETAARKAREESRSIPVVGFVEVAPAKNDEKVVHLNFCRTYEQNAARRGQYDDEDPKK